MLKAVLWQYAEINQERQQLGKALDHYVPDEVVINWREMSSISSRAARSSMGLADVAGYTTLSEKMTPQQLGDVMHRHCEATFEP